MDIVINSRYEAASTKIFVTDLSPKLAEYHDVTQDDWDNYEEYDVALFMESEHIPKARTQNPDLGIGLVDAKIEDSDIDELQMADFLIVGSIEQKNELLKYHDDIIIYRDFPEYEYGEPRQHKHQETVTIGYHGNRKHLRDFEPIITRALEEVGQYYDIELHVIYNIEQLGRWDTGVPDNVKVRHLQWSPDVYREHLRKVDIGIKNDCIPFENRFARLVMGKSPADFLWNINEHYIHSDFLEYLLNKQDVFPVYNYREHDYLTRYKYPTNPGRFYPFAQLNIPVIADFTPSNAEMITHGESGFLASTQSSWERYLTELIENPTKRQSVGEKLQKEIAERHSLNQSFDRLNKYVIDQFSEK